MVDVLPCTQPHHTPECTGTSVTPWTGHMRYKSLALKRARMNLFRFCFWISIPPSMRWECGNPEGISKRRGRVESRHFGFLCFPLLVISNAHACQCEVGSSAIITDAKRVCEHSSPRLRKDESAPITVIALSPPVPFHLLGK
jgi:hypothetical protein